MGDLKVTYRPIQNEREQAAYEAALDTLIGMALRKIVEERNCELYTQHGKEPILVTLPEAVKE